MSRDLSKYKSYSFKPICLQDAPAADSSLTKITVTTTVKGSVAEEFERMCAQTKLNRSQLLLQMVYHCLDKTEDLKDLYRRLAILGK